MARRASDLYYTFRCAHDGCREIKQYSYSTRKEHAEATRKYNGTVWHCQKHDPDGGNVNPNSEPRKVVVIRECEYRGGYKSWSGRNSSNATYIMDSPLWNADAADFPVGAKIIIETTIRVELPSE